MDSLGNIIDMVIVVLLMFLIPVMWGEGKIRELSEKSKSDYCQEFLTNICEKGYISISAYEAFSGKMQLDGSTVVEIQHQRNGLFDNGENRNNYFENEIMYTDEILDELYSKGEYRFDIGDEVTIAVCKNRGSTYLTGLQLMSPATGYYSCTLSVTGGKM